MSTPDSEVWKDVPDYETKYRISNLGSLWSVKYSRLMNPSLNDGYRKARIGGRNTGVHRLVALAFIPNPANKPCVNHINGNKLDNRLENLEWVTNEENTEHAINTGLFYHAQKDPARRLNVNKVANILHMREDVSQEKLAKIYFTSPTNIFGIIHRRKWKHVK